MTASEPLAKNPRRVAAGKRNRALRIGLSDAGRQRLRESALQHRPWLHTTGPKTAASKARSAANGKVRQMGPVSVRQLRAELADLRALAREMQEGRKMVPGLRAEEG